ncbi:solute carrier family 35 member c2 [Chrysochromulina tobinii]|uniref:Solute carrier family 35 member c2 n=1 Tax=Chrysochromulina tobinii TaxID=1460289 RepID=A0A0M0JK55_9EUKA|nr:solute carrier family 35 member c2 [Chrysochromulina tobinii]|eukprot:KOO26633.1 solute carrier family 35 member c2 [Chrysochromulina sp. CCMP291]
MWLVYVVGWYASSCAIIFTNKFLLTDREFKFPFTLAAITNAVVFLISWLSTRPSCWRPEPLPWHTTLYVVAPIGLLTALDIGVSNWALVHLSVALHTIVRGTVPAFVLGFSLLLRLQEPSWLIVGSIFTVCVGIGFAAYGDVDCDALGLGLALLSCVFSGLRWAMTQVLVKARPIDAPNLPDALGWRQRSPVASIYHVTPACAICSASAAWVLESHALLESGDKVLAFARGELLVYNACIGALVFGLLFSAEGSQHSSSSLTLVIGLSTVLADALSMAAGEYLSAKAEDDISGASADEPPPLEKAIAMFVAFTSFGCMPLMAYIVSALIAHHSGIAADPRASFLLSTGISGLSLFALGAIKSRFGDTGDWLKSGLEVTGVGGCAATVAFFTAKLIDQHLG